MKAYETSHVREMSAYGAPGQAICVLTEGKMALVTVAARTKGEFKGVESRIGVSFHQG